jgi:hypothetical protein
MADVPSTGVGAVIGAELPALLAQLRAAIRAGCPATVESDRRDQGITGCLELDRAGRLPI